MSSVLSVLVGLVPFSAGSCPVRMNIMPLIVAITVSPGLTVAASPPVPRSQQEFSFTIHTDLPWSQ